MKLPKVSINLCCYNSEKNLRETLESIVKQTYKDWELIIINDGSSDSTESIIYEYVNQGFPITYHCQENKGLGYSRNEALSRSQGEYIAFIDHDDIWVAGKLNRQVQFLDQNPEVDFLYSNFFMLDEGKNKQYLAFTNPQPSGFVFEQFLYRYTVGVLTVLIRKKAFSKLNGLFDEKLRLAEEYDVFMRILHDAKAYYMSEPLAVYRIHPNMASLRFIENYPVEIVYVSEKLKQLDQNNPQKYAKAFKDQQIQLEYMKAKTKMAQGDFKEARTYLTRNKLFSPNHFFLYCATYLPLSLWFLLRPLWEKGTFRQLP